MKRFTIEVKITKAGGVEGTLKGIKGPSCAGKMDFLKEVGTVTTDSRTAEYNQCEPAQVKTGSR